MLNSPVTKVDYSAGGVVVQAGDRRYQASNALVTVSVGVLRAKRIAFEPPLPAWKQEAIDHLRMGNLQKIIIPFNQDIFRMSCRTRGSSSRGSLLPEELKLAEQNQLGAERGQRRVMAFVIKPLNTNIAIGFFGGDWARAFEGQCQGLESGSGLRSKSGCDDLAIKVATMALSKMYGEKHVVDAIQNNDIQVTHWSLDETSLGAYSAPEPGHWDKHAILRRPVGRSVLRGRGRRPSDLQRLLPRRLRVGHRGRPSHSCRADRAINYH